ncbi:hypothetical protein MPSEU_000850400 [Mayamaea pseudoterrestris]|nr:hypothetical protein MPSEU_000850400 [Mayamaea pseudoterrestris]
MVSFNNHRRPILHQHRGLVQNRRDPKGGRKFALLSSFLLVILMGVYIAIGQVFLMQPGAIESPSERMTAMDILRKEQLDRRRKQARIQAESSATNKARYTDGRGTTDVSVEAMKLTERDQGMRLAVVEDKSMREKVDESSRKDAYIVREDRNDDGTDDDGMSGEQDDTNDDNEGDDTTAEKEPSKRRHTAGTDDDVAIRNKLIDDEVEEMPLDEKREIDTVRRRMDEDLNQQIGIKLERTSDHDNKNVHRIDKQSTLDAMRKKRLERINKSQHGVYNNVVDDNVFDKQNQTAKEVKVPRKLPVVERLAAVQHAPVEGDPLRAEVWDFESKGRLPIKPAIPYLGTLIDAGRHYFPIPWLRRTIDRLSDMNYNLIQLRLTDDQTFNVLLKSRPQLAYPTALWNPDRKVYTPDELRDLTAYAKARGISIMPEINVPGHAGSWAGIPDMIVHCPGFICEKGYGLPLNVTHHDLKPILTDVIKEIVDIFDNPPFLHLGGDEVNMADPCFNEVGHRVFDYDKFELVLKEIINATGYPEDRVVRWEMTGQKALVRAGAIEQFWESYPGLRHNPKGRFFVSAGLYFDTNMDQDAYEVYSKAVLNFSYPGGKTPTAIIAGTFELDSQFWYDRNILGRLLAVAIGVANQSITGTDLEKQTSVLGQWNSYCKDLGFGEIICDTDGQPVISSQIYREKWRKGWEVWKSDICERLTTSVPHRTFKEIGDRMLRQAIGSGNEYFWKNFALDIEIKRPEARPLAVMPQTLLLLEKHTVPNVGVIIDAVSAMPTIKRIHSIIQDYVVKLGMNTVQLRLISESGWVYESDIHPRLAQSLIAGNDNPFYTLRDLEKLVEDAGNSGVQIIPEITLSSDAGGWINTQFLANCPDHFCSDQGTPININDEKFLPVLYSVVAELRKVFNSKYIHLGSDEREASAPCFEAAKINPAWSGFERKLETLMALADVTTSNIIRSDNLEGIRYPDRTGDITQYPPGVIETRPNEGVFLSVDIFDGDGYRVFQNTQKAVNKNPLGILAELRKLSVSKWKLWHVPKRLLAFAMGLSELGTTWSIYDAPTFSSQFTKLCQELELEDDCAPPDEFMGSILAITDSQEFIKKTCDIRTNLGEKKLAIPVKPFFIVQGDGEAVAST